MPAPALAVDHREPNASPPEEEDLEVGLLKELPEVRDGLELVDREAVGGTGTEVK